MQSIRNPGKVPDMLDPSNLDRLAQISKQLSTATRNDLIATNELLASIISNASISIVAKDNEGVITVWNPAAEELYGYSSEEAIGKNASILVPDERLAEFQEIMDHIKNGEGVGGLRTQRKRKDNQIIDVILTISPVRDHAGQVIGASSIARLAHIEISSHEDRQATTSG